MPPFHWAEDPGESALGRDKQLIKSKNWRTGLFTRCWGSELTWRELEATNDRKRLLKKRHADLDMAIFQTCACLWSNNSTWVGAVGTVLSAEDQKKLQTNFKAQMLLMAMQYEEAGVGNRVELCLNPATVRDIATGGTDFVSKSDDSKHYTLIGISFNPSGDSSSNSLVCHLCCCTDRMAPQLRPESADFALKNNSTVVVRFSDRHAYTCHCCNKPVEDILRSHKKQGDIVMDSRADANSAAAAGGGAAAAGAGYTSEVERSADDVSDEDAEEVAQPRRRAKPQPKKKVSLSL